MTPIAYSDRYIYELPQGHKFPIEKYELVHDQLLHEGTCSVEQFYDAGLCSDEEVTGTHCSDHWRRITEGGLTNRELRRVGIPIYETSILRARNSAAGTIRTAEHALDQGIALNLAGGTHHAFYDRSEAFSIINDLAMAADHVRLNGLADHILIVDLDVHQGNGTASLFRESDQVFTFSMHCKSNYPFHKERSDRDVELAPDTGDEPYLDQLQQHLPAVMEQHRPDLILYQAGVDVLKHDKLGKLALSKSGCRERDTYVFREARRKGIPIAVTMGGGYSTRTADLVEAHTNTFREASRANS